MTLGQLVSTVALRLFLMMLFCAGPWGFAWLCLSSFKPMADDWEAGNEVPRSRPGGRR